MSSWRVSKAAIGPTRQAFRLSLSLIDDGVENVTAPQIAPSPAPAKELRF